MTRGGGCACLALVHCWNGSRAGEGKSEQGTNGSSHSRLSSPVSREPN